MPTGYRIEVAPNNRAGCKNKECKDAGDKITKGDLRFGSLFTVMEHTSWAYKHWGCVTPEQIKNLNTFLDGDMDAFEGFDELSQDLQDKVSEALKNGHVADEDWKGDVELNRPGKKGFKQKTSKKKQDQKGGQDDGDDGSPKPKKRGRKTKDADEDEAPAPKKVKGTKTKSEDAEKEEPKPKPKKGGAKKSAVKDEDDAADVKPAPESKKPRRKAATKKAIVEEPSDDDISEEEQEPPKAKRGKKAAPQKR